MIRNKRKRNTILLVSAFLAASAAIYMIQIFVFHDPANTAFYLLQDLAFVPVQVILVTLFINELLNTREKQSKAKKINVMISTFFIETGTGLIRILSRGNGNVQELRDLLSPAELEKRRNAGLMRKLKSIDMEMNCTPELLSDTRVFLRENKALILSMLENPHILEHDSFTDMLWAVFHMTDELNSRDSLDELPSSDMNHLNVDFLRAYRLLVLEWLNYIRYLHAEYPYLHSLAIRNDPFLEHVDVRVLEPAEN